VAELLKHSGEVFCAVKYLNSTLQVDKFKLPQAAQTLLALQWPDFCCPRSALVLCLGHFESYQEGAFYPTQHFEHVINSLVKVIESQGQVLLNHEVTNTDSQTEL